MALKEMNDRKTTHTSLRCNSKEIGIQTNTFSDASEFSEDSDCNPFPKKTEPYTDIKFKNPYVRLVRCDHLLSNGSATVSASKGDILQARNCSRSSLRKKRPNRNYKADDFIFYDFTNVDDRRKQSAYLKHTRKQKVYIDAKRNKKKNDSDKRNKKKNDSKRIKKTFMSETKDNFAETLQHRRNKTGNCRVSKYDRLPTTNDKVDKTQHTVASNNIQQEPADNEDQFISQYIKGGDIRQDPNEDSALKLQNVVVKSEPCDDYFDNVIDKELQHVTERDNVYNNVKTEPSDAFVSHQNGAEDRVTLPGWRDFENTTQEENSNVYIKHELCIETDEHESYEESDSSDVDIENDWDCSNFIFCQKVIEFDHCYNLPKTYEKAEADDTEVRCSSTVVENFRRKEKNNEIREVTTVVCVINRRSETEDEFLLTRRSHEGLMWGLWEFPNRTYDETYLIDSKRSGIFGWDILKNYSVKLTGEWSERNCGKIKQIFTDTHQTFIVQGITVHPSKIKVEDTCNYTWVTREKFMDMALFTSMRKIFKVYQASFKNRKQRSSAMHCASEKKRRGEMASFFTSLRELIPELEGKKKTPKLEILRLAAEYIKCLEQTEVERINTLRELTAAKIENIKKKRCLLRYLINTKMPDKVFQ